MIGLGALREQGQRDLEARRRKLQRRADPPDVEHVWLSTSQVAELLGVSDRIREDDRDLTPPGWSGAADSSTTSVQYGEADPGCPPPPKRTKRVRSSHVVNASRGPNVEVAECTRHRTIGFVIETTHT